jgi:hypothetical protein
VNRIVRDHYPAERLPDDLQKLVDPSRPIRVVLEQDDDHKPRKSPEELLAMLDAYRATIKGTGVSTEDAVARIRELRDEWDD